MHSMNMHFPTACMLLRNERLFAKQFDA